MGFKCANAYKEQESGLRILKKLPEEKIRELMNPEEGSKELIRALLEQIEYSNTEINR